MTLDAWFTFVIPVPRTPEALPEACKRKVLAIQKSNLDYLLYPTIYLFGPRAVLETESDLLKQLFGSENDFGPIAPDILCININT